MPSASPTRSGNYLLVKGKAGLGNRIVCLLTAILYAQLTGRELLVDWSDDDYSDDGTNVFHRLFQCAVCDPETTIPATDSVRPALWRGHLHDTALAVQQQLAPHTLGDPLAWQHLSVDLRTLDYPEDVLVMWSYVEQVNRLRRYFTGPLKPLRWKPTKVILKRVYRDHLRLHPALQARVDQFVGEHLRGPTVGVHIRYSDKRSRLDAILHKLDALLRQNPDLRVFLATDNARIDEHVHTTYSRVVSTSKWYPAGDRPMHKHPASPDRVGHAADALLDLYALAACDYLILDESSSFAYVASLLTQTPPGRVFNLQRGHWIPPLIRHVLWLTKTHVQRKARRVLAVCCVV